MKCTRPTIVNCYKIPEYENQLVRYIYNIPPNEIANNLRTTGTNEIISISQKEADLIDIQRIKAGTHIKALITGSYLIPCNKCEACIEEIKREKAARILLDYIQSKKENPKTDGHFITLTYDEEHIPKNKQLSILDLEHYIYKLKLIDPHIKYYACGEYGSQTLRPHYHIITWNEKNKIPYGKKRLTQIGNIYDTYELTEYKLWENGRVTIAPIDKRNIAYCAGYANKKLNRTKEEKEELRKAHIQPEFNLSSRAIAYNYYQANLKKILKNEGKIYEAGQTITTDRSFKKFLERENLPIPEWITNHTTTINLTDTKEKYEEKEATQKKNNKTRRK